MEDLLVVGAGPYGLSVAAHAAAAGLSLRVLGRPMATWRDHMPAGMFLKSEPWASDLSDPAGRRGLGAYRAALGTPARHGEPLPVRAFADYGLWFARHAVPAVEERTVTRVDARPGGFTATTGDGGTVTARTVALAVGVLPFAEIPAALRALPAGLVSHSGAHGTLDRFRGRDVTVIGGGQAALETAALLAEQGTRVRVLTRAGHPDWNDVPPPWRRPWWRAARAPHTALGCGWRNWFYAERPGLFRRLPSAARTRITASALGPAGAWWLRERVETGVEIRPGQEVTAARAVPGGVRLEVRGGSPLETEHVIAATGFRPTRARLGPLAPELRQALAALPDGSPAVGRYFESSYPGLFLAGPVTASAFGPAMRFVHGTGFTAPALVRGVRRRLRARTPYGGVPAPAGGTWRNVTADTGP
ncbi:FAD-dependent oxidoreductase [Streptomyces sp. NPDC058417]|uniref:FAD-dependent oxidoreductase n=1 Tax=unclassified Streptomyces TaxID=2593676 RepID=UPI00365A9778